MSVSFSEVYATGNDKRIADKKTENGGLHQAIIKTDDEKYRVDADYDVAINDDDTYAITKNGDADDTKNLRLHTGDDITIKFKCPENEWENTDYGDYKGITVYLVDKDEKDIDIALKKADRIETVGEERCDEPLEDCKFEGEISDDIDEGKYKLVISAAWDEGNVYFINKAKIKE